MKLHCAVSPQCASVDSVNNLRHCEHAYALHSLIQWLSVHQNEHCSVLQRITIVNHTQLSHAHTFAAILSGNRTAPQHIGAVWYCVALFVLKCIPAFNYNGCHKTP